MEFLLPLISFAFVTSVTPGPNNLLLLTSGLRFGFKRSLPHILGVQAGVALQLYLSAVGLSQLLMQWPAFTLALKLSGTTYLLYLAWNLRPKLLLTTGSTKGKPFTFVQAVLFQFINPKAWMMTMTAGALFVPDFSSHYLSALMVCLVFNSVGTPSSGSWALVGGFIKNWLDDPRWKLIFSFLMMGLIVFTVTYIWWI